MAPSMSPAATASPRPTLTLPRRRWQYCDVQPSPWSIRTPLPHSRPCRLSSPARSGLSSWPSRAPTTVPAAAASTSMGAPSGSVGAMSVPLWPSEARMPQRWSR